MLKVIVGQLQTLINWLQLSELMAGLISQALGFGSSATIRALATISQAWGGMFPFPPQNP